MAVLTFLQMLGLPTRSFRHIFLLSTSSQITTWRLTNYESSAYALDFFLTSAYDLTHVYYSVFYHVALPLHLAPPVSSLLCRIPVCPRISLLTSS